MKWMAFPFKAQTNKCASRTDHCKGNNTDNQRQFHTSQFLLESQALPVEVAT